VSRPVGTCCLVLHSHLPWLAHHGAWPVGEEWLHQAWAGAYLPVVGMLGRLADEGRRDLITLGVTPVLAAMLDDPYCLREFHTWLGMWQLRAEDALVRGVGVASYEGGLAATALAQFEAGWRNGGAPLLRGLADAGAVQLLGGPATHTFTPFLPDRIARFALRVGLDDASIRLGSRPAGIWAPECAYVPGLEQGYDSHGVTHFVVDGPLAHGRTGAPIDVAGSGVLAFARDLEVTYRVWSPRSGYPGDPRYRDFHTFDHDSGLRPARVTSRHTEPWNKQRYEPAAALAVVARDAADFVAHVVARMRALPEEDPLVVVAYDTELFGHWWHEGPAFLEAVLRMLPQAGVRVTTLERAGAMLPARPAELPAGSWGSGKDFHVWQVPDLQQMHSQVSERLLRVVDKRGGADRDPLLDQLARAGLLALASDWPFCVSKDSAAGYARDRALGHAADFHRLADALEAADDRAAARAAAHSAGRDYPFGHLDARGLGGRV
jgi:1,4-alpha-glucan branching enzyme